MEGTEMAKAVKRNKTKYPNIYFNENTKKYDVKHNYKEYDPLRQKNVYKARWIYNCATITEARAALANLQTGGIKTSGKDMTLQSAFDLWKIKAAAQNYSKTTVLNTEQQLRTISKYLPLSTKLDHINEEVYYRLFDCLRKEYSEETIHTLNSAFRKLIHLAYKKGYITDNFLHKADNIRTRQKDQFRILTHAEFEKIDSYLGGKQSNHRGYNAYPKLQFFYNVLYYTGIRLGECLALTWADFEEFRYDPPEQSGEAGTTAQKCLSGMRLKVTKSILRTGEIKEPKNLKKRTIPLPPPLEALYRREHEKHTAGGGTNTERIFTYAPPYCLIRIKATCEIVKIESCSCHAFRHTYISNLIRNSVPLSVIEKVSGDTQGTIFKRYSHMFQDDERLVLNALEHVSGAK